MSKDNNRGVVSQANPTVDHHEAAELSRKERRRLKKLRKQAKRKHSEVGEAEGLDQNVQGEVQGEPPAKKRKRSNGHKHRRESDAGPSRQDLPEEDDNVDATPAVTVHAQEEEELASEPDPIRQEDVAEQVDQAEADEQTEQTEPKEQVLPEEETEQTAQEPDDHGQSSQDEDFIVDEKGRRLSHREALRKWWVLPKFNEYAKTQGLRFKKGKFSSEEATAVQKGIRKISARHKITPDTLVGYLFVSQQDRMPHNKILSEMWEELCNRLPDRPVRTIWSYTKRHYNPQARCGKWTEEEDRTLLNAVKKYGLAWEAVSVSTGRTAEASKDRYRRISDRAQHTDGSVDQEDVVRKPARKWSEKEVATLVRAHTDIVKKRGFIVWKEVAQMVGTHSTLQCQDKWYDLVDRNGIAHLNHLADEDEQLMEDGDQLMDDGADDQGEAVVPLQPAMEEARKRKGRPHWGRTHYEFLVRAIEDQDVEREADIDWEVIEAFDPALEGFSSKRFRRRWRHLKTRCATKLGLAKPTIAQIAQYSLSALSTPNEKLSNDTQEYKSSQFVQSGSEDEQDDGT